MVLIRMALVLLVVSCTPFLGSDRPAAVISASPSASSPPTCLSGRRLAFLADQFFVRYNARDLDAFLELFNFAASAAGGGFGQYFDDPGEARTANDRTTLADYARQRWAIDDRFVSWSPGDMPDGLSYPNANPTVSFTRSFAGVTQGGNVKLVCNAGLLVDVVMSSSKR